MSTVINLYLYRLKKEIMAAVEKQKVNPVIYPDMEQQQNDLYVFYGEHFSPELIPFVRKSKK